MPTQYNSDGSVTCFGIADPSRTATYPPPRNGTTQNASVAAFYALEPPSPANLFSNYVTLFALAGADMNSTSDQVFIPNPSLSFSQYTPILIVASNPSISLTNAAGGIYSGASKGGTILCTASQVYSGLTTGSSIINPQVAVSGQQILSSSPPYLSLTTPQGSAATANFTIMGLFS